MGLVIKRSYQSKEVHTSISTDCLSPKDAQVAIRVKR